MQLLKDPVFLLLTVIVIGELIGSLKYHSFSLDSSAIIFVALIFGALGYTLPGDLQQLGLVLFLYSVGIQAGSGFLSSFKSGGIMLSAGAFIIVFIGFLVTLIVSLAMGLDSSAAAGIFAGAMTSTPGLAVAAELADGKTAGSAYGLTYTFGVIGVILFVRFIPQLSRKNIKNEEFLMNQETMQERPPVTYIHIEVTNKNLHGKKIKDLDLHLMGAVNITRVLRKGAHHPVLGGGDVTLHTGDAIRVVGREDDLKRAVLYIGKKIKASIDFNSVLETRKIVVSNKEIMGESAASLNIKNVYNVQIARLCRNGIDLPATGAYRFAVGDMLTLVGQKEALDNVTKLLGNDITAAYTTKVISVLMGIFIGFLLGKVPLYIPFAGEFYAGTSGGVLAAGLILGHLKKTGPVIWELPETAVAFIRELGLFFFLASVGTAAGSTILATIRSSGPMIILAGILITVFPPVIFYFLNHHFFRIPFLRLLGVITGGMTSTPGLAAAQSVSPTRYASSAYATVYPVALVSMILFTRLLISLMDLVRSSGFL